MRAWLEGVAGPEYAMALLWTLAALVLLAVLLVIIRIVRGLTFGTFVAGGRNRKTRLAVMDATAVDSHRRLVLVRRDDVEHLLLIGGPTDVVVEQDIRFHVQQRRASPPAGELPDQPLRAADRSRPTEVQQQAAHRPERPDRAELPRMERAELPRADKAEPARTERSEAPPRPIDTAARPLPTQPQRAAERVAPQLVRQPLAAEPQAASPTAPEPRTVPPENRTPPRLPPAVHSNGPAMPYLGTRAMPAPAKPAARDEIDNALLDELEVNLDNGIAAQKRPVRAELSLEDEMTKLLGELSSHKR